ncbi:MAG: OB-fold nucleic acid binding domain-containing protein [Candidatus Woesearchaeota archaeon]
MGLNKVNAAHLMIALKSYMEIKDIKANAGNIDIVAKVTEKESPREFEKFGKTGKVCNAKLKDGSGEVKLTLWNEDVDKVNVGDKIHLQNGWCSEYKGEKQLSSGKFGKIEIVEKSTGMQPGEVLTNDPSMLGQQQMMESDEDSEESDSGPNLEDLEEDVE